MSENEEDENNDNNEGLVAVAHYIMVTMPRKKRKRGAERSTNQSQENTNLRQVSNTLETKER
jgi:hypothetical protein